MGSYNVGVLVLNIFSSLLFTTTLLQLLQCCYTMLTVDDNEFSILDLVPQCWLCGKKLQFRTNWHKTNFLSLSYVPHLNRLDNYFLQLTNDEFVIGNVTLIDADRKCFTRTKNVSIFAILSERILDFGELLKIRLVLCLSGFGLRCLRQN